MQHRNNPAKISFFRGSRNDVITENEIIEQFRSAEVQFLSRMALISREAPRSQQRQVNVLELAVLL